jgi:hypothetical protein
MLNHNWNLRKLTGGILSAVALLSIAGGLVSCGFAGGEAEENETEEMEENEDREEDDDND